jgi:hypothetical protein
MPSAFKPCHRTTLSGRNSAVECQLPKLDVAGSSPVARSNYLFPVFIQSPENIIFFLQ